MMLFLVEYNGIINKIFEFLLHKKNNHNFYL